MFPPIKDTLCSTLDKNMGGVAPGWAYTSTFTVNVKSVC